MVLLINFLLFLIPILFIISLIIAKKTSLSYWLKGGIIGTTILWPIGYIALAILRGFYSPSYPNPIDKLYASKDFIPIPNLYGWLICLSIGFLLGALIGWLVGKFKKK